MSNEGDQLSDGSARGDCRGQLTFRPQSTSTDDKSSGVFCLTAVFYTFGLLIKRLWIAVTPSQYNPLILTFSSFEFTNKILYKPRHNSRPVVNEAY